MLRTACHAWHVSHGGRMVDFAGWEMPVQYTSIIQEHQAVRTSAGLFDIAHMGRLRFSGPDACAFLDHLLTNDVRRLEPGEIRYSLVLNEQGKTLDDVLVYRLESSYLLVVNASNRLKIVDWVRSHLDGFNVMADDETLATFMMAVQGPRAFEVLRTHVNVDLAPLGYYRATEGTVVGRPALISRTGYTGEDGFEIIISSSDGQDVWYRLLTDGKEEHLQPCGLGARDTLRLEAGMPLYGHEIDEATDPLTAGLGFAVKLAAAEFIGKAALLAVKSAGPQQTRVGLVLAGKRIAREGAAVFAGDRQAGTVTSGTFSPTLERSIAMAYVSNDLAKVGTAVEVDIRGKREAASVVKLPFYNRSA